jgi:hypothetical protein
MALFDSVVAPNVALIRIALLALLANTIPTSLCPNPRTTPLPPKPLPRSPQLMNGSKRKTLETSGRRC